MVKISEPVCHKMLPWHPELLCHKMAAELVPLASKDLIFGFTSVTSG